MESKAKPLFSRKSLIKIIFPLIIQQLLAVTIGMADSMMVASAGEEAVSGVSLVTTLDILLICAFSALATGGAIVISQFIGKKDFDLARSSAKQLIYATTGVAVIIAASVLVFRVPLLNVLFGDVEDAVMSNAQSYFFFIALSFPFLGLFDAGAAIFRAMGNSMISMTSSILMNVINLIGNAILIYVFHLGAAGAAIATLISRIIGAVIITVLVHNKKNAVYVERIFHYRPNFKIIKSILRVGVPNGIENSMFQFGKLLTQSLISSMGTAAIAANAVAHTIATFQYMPGGAIGLATITIVGRCVGAQEKEQAKKYARLLLGITYACLWFIVILTFLLYRPVINIYNLSAEASAMAHDLIIYHAICAAVIWPIAFTLPNSFRAASDVKFTLIISAFSMWAFRVGTCYILALESINLFGITVPGFGLGVLGVWVAMTLDWLFRAILFAFRYLTGKWLTKYKPIENKENRETV
ncbi:MAG: MATE family efflux transporter [Ruminococcaceae bacterium]|nr:MATE family efflux transporter [Oscillospiraceae bacterium]